MNFNRRGPDRRPDRPDRPNRPPQRRGDWQPRERGDERPYVPRDRGPGADRGFAGRDRPPQPRGRFDRGADEGGMSIRLDPRRLGTLKHLAGEAGVRPGDLVRQWVEERLDASRGGSVSGEAVAAGPDLVARLDDLAARVAALEAGGGRGAPPTTAPSADEVSADEAPAQDRRDDSVSEQAPAKASRPRRTASARPSSQRVGLHDEMIAVIGEHGPMTAGELAAAITERGRYTPPRSGKPLDAATVSQRASNPTYRSRFTRAEGRIGLAEPPAG